MVDYINLAFIVPASFIFLLELIDVLKKHATKIVKIFDYIKKPLLSLASQLLSLVSKITIGQIKILSYVAAGCVLVYGLCAYSNHSIEFGPITWFGGGVLYFGILFLLNDVRKEMEKWMQQKNPPKSP